MKSGSDAEQDEAEKREREQHLDERQAATRRRRFVIVMAVIARPPA